MSTRPNELKLPKTLQVTCQRRPHAPFYNAPAHGTPARRSRAAAVPRALHAAPPRFARVDVRRRCPRRADRDAEGASAAVFLRRPRLGPLLRHLRAAGVLRD